MSGGSFNYLGLATDGEDVIEKRSELQEMADALAELGYADDAARETRALLMDIRAMMVRLDVAAQRLSPVWREIEWWYSADSSEDAFKGALAKYRGGAS